MTSQPTTVQNGFLQYETREAFRKSLDGLTWAPPRVLFWYPTQEVQSGQKLKWETKFHVATCDTQTRPWTWTGSPTRRCRTRLECAEMPNRVKRAIETRMKCKSNEEEAKRIATKIEKINLTIKQYRKFIQDSNHPKPAQDSKTAEGEEAVMSPSAARTLLRTVTGFSF